MAKAKAQLSEYITLDEVLARLNVSREVHFQSAALPNYPQAKYDGTVLLGYSRVDVDSYLKNLMRNGSEPPTDPLVDASIKLSQAMLAAPVGLIAESVPVEQVIADPHITHRTIEVPVGDRLLASANAIADSHYANWSEPDKLRWRMILVGLIRSGAKYLDVRAPAGKQLKSVKSIAGAQLWMIQQLAPLSQDDVNSIHWQKRMQAEC